MGVASIGNWQRRRLETILGQPPAVGEQMPGCRFAPRCRYASSQCVAEPVPLTDLGEGRAARCVLLDDRPAPTAQEASA